jgi:hypothetical protein
LHAAASDVPSDPISATDFGSILDQATISGFETSKVKNAREGPASPIVITHDDSIVAPAVTLRLLTNTLPETDETKNFAPSY